MRSNPMQHHIQANEKPYSSPIYGKLARTRPGIIGVPPISYLSQWILTNLMHIHSPVTAWMAQSDFIYIFPVLKWINQKMKPELGMIPDGWVCVDLEAPFQGKQIDTFSLGATFATIIANLKSNSARGIYFSSLLRLFALIETIHGCKNQVWLLLFCPCAASWC